MTAYMVDITVSIRRTGETTKQVSSRILDTEFFECAEESVTAAIDALHDAATMLKRPPEQIH